MKASLIAPCGMNCAICSAYLRDKKRCPGSGLLNAKLPVSIEKCRIRNCPWIKEKNYRFCSECPDFPCARLKNLDKRYRTKYNMSEIENLLFIKEKGIREFIRNEKQKWSCSKCGGTINVHKGICSRCGMKLKPETED